MAQSRDEREVETLYLAISLCVVLGVGDIIPPKGVINCEKVLPHELRAFAGKYIKQYIAICHLVFKEAASYCDAVCF